MKVKRLRCGGCGGTEANVCVEVADDYSNGGSFRAIILHCVKCKSKTRLWQQTGLRVDNSVDSEGTFCVY